MPGRHNLPTSLKAAKGTLEKGRIKTTLQPKAIERLPPMPKYLSKTARKIYQSKGKELLTKGILTSLDVEAFLSYCIETGRYFDTFETIQCFKGEPTELKILLRQNEAAFARMKILSGEFGLTPITRQRIEQPPTQSENEIEFDNL
jgi:P27 family predicted phage terminase small subunit